MKIPFLIGLTGVVGAVIAAQAGSADSILAKHTKQLQTATTLNAEFTVQVLPGGPSDYKLKLAKPAKFRLETPTEVVVGDGTTVWDYKKADNSYTQLPQTADDVKALLKREALLSWGAFFAKEPFKDTTGIKVGSKHMIKGKTVVDVSLILPGKPEKTATLFIDQDLGVARGVSIATAPDKNTIILAKDLAFSSDQAKDSDFEFAVPDGAKKVDPNAKSAGTTFEKVSPIFQNNCIGCHNSGRPRSGLDLSSYAGAIAGGRNGKDIVPGDPDNSPILAYLRANGKPQMPPSGLLAESDIALITAWIKDGAKEK
jgi:outer membrane lipoprotein-sorting protein